MKAHTALKSDEIEFDLISKFNYKEEIELCCFVCSNVFFRNKNSLIQNIKRKRKTTCSRSCASKIQSDKHKIKTNIECSHCQKKFYKKNHLILKHKNHYCSIHCKNSGKIKKDKIKSVSLIPKNISMEGVTKGMLYERRKNWQSARSAIQKHARKVFLESSEKKICYECGYSRHYEVCHIKNVSSFEDNELIIEINNLKNLIALCPTHHWEFDNGFLFINK